MIQRADFARKISVLAIVMIVIALQSLVLFGRYPSGDYNCYAVPAGNVLRTGELATPQLGTQLELDRLWRFNSPLLGYGPLPFFAVGGVNHGSYLLGAFGLLLLSVAGFNLLTRLALPGKPVAAAVYAAAIQLPFNFLSEFVNQRYTLIAALSVAALYFPVKRHRHTAPAWQWWLAGMLPLIHPALLIGSIIWGIAEGIQQLRAKRWPFSAVGGVGFLALVGLNAVWYLEPHGLKVHFLPHLAGRDFVPFSGWQQGIPGKYAMPSQLLLLSIVFGFLYAILRRSVTGLPFGRCLMLLLVVIGLDFLGRMLYLNYFVIGIAASLPLFLGQRLNRWLVLGAALFVIAETVIVIKFHRTPLGVMSNEAAEEFIEQHTRRGDRIVLGPPFVLNSTRTNWPGERSVEYVVPMPLFMKEFNPGQFVQTIRGSCTVYVGEPRYYDGVQLYYKFGGPTVFADANLEMVEFRGVQILVARQQSAAP